MEHLTQAVWESFALLLLSGLILTLAIAQIAIERKRHREMVQRYRRELQNRRSVERINKILADTVEMYSRPLKGKVVVEP